MRIASVVAAWVGVLAVARAGTPDPTSLAMQVGDVVHGGDALVDAVPKIVKLLGPPAVADAERLQWAVVRDRFCVYAFVVRDGTWVKTWDSGGIGEGAEHYADCTQLAGKHAKLPKLPAPPKLDVDAPTHTIMAHWKAREFQAIFDAADPQLRDVLKGPGILEYLADLFTPVAGKFVKLGPLQRTSRRSGVQVKVPAIYEKGTLTAELEFHLVDDKPTLSAFDLTAPKEMLPTPVPKEGEKVARRALDLLLADKLDDFIGLAHPELRNKLTPKDDFEKQLAGLLQKMGKVKKAGWTDLHDCANTAPVAAQQCITYEIQTTNGTSKAVFRMVLHISRWEVIEFNVEPPKK